MILYVVVWTMLQVAATLHGMQPPTHGVKIILATEQKVVYIKCIGDTQSKIKR